MILRLEIRDCLRDVCEFESVQRERSGKKAEKEQGEKAQKLEKQNYVYNDNYL